MKTKPKSPKNKPAQSAATKKAKPSADAGTKKAAPPPAIPTCEVPYKRVELALADIAIVYNAREEFSEEETEGLADSIQASGLQHDLWVYRLKKPGKRGETHGLIAGERRIRALTKLGWLKVWCRDYDASEREILQLGLIDNLQRENLSEIEEAFAFKKLIAEGGLKAWDPADPQNSLGHRIGVSKTNIYAALKLTELPKLGVDAVKKGELSPSVGIRIARIPNLAAQKAALQDAIRWNWTDAHAAQQIARRYMTELKGAPFDRKDETLNPERGSCEKCPYRSGNQADLYPEMAKGRGDICTDTSCFRLKCERSFDIRAEAHRKAGGKVLSVAEAKKAGLGDSYSSVGGEYVELDQAAWSVGDGKKTYRQLLGEALKSGDLLPTLAKANDGSGEHFEIITREEATLAAKKLGLKAPARSSGGGGEDEWRKKRNEEAARDKARVAHWLGRIAERASQETALLLEPTPMRLLRWNIKWLIKKANCDALRRIAERRNLDRKNFQLKDESPAEWLGRAMESILADCQTPAAALTFQLELMASPDYTPNNGGLSAQAAIVAEMLCFESGELERDSRAAVKAAEHEKLHGTVPEGATFCEWSQLNAFQTNSIGKRFKDTPKSERRKYKYTFDATVRVLARRLLKEPPAPRLWEQLAAWEQALAERLLEDDLIKSASFAFFEGRLTQTPIDEAYDSNPVTVADERVDDVVKMRRKGQVSTGKLREILRVPSEEAGWLLDAAIDAAADADQPEETLI